MGRSLRSPASQSHWFVMFQAERLYHNKQGGWHLRNDNWGWLLASACVCVTFAHLWITHTHTSLMLFHQSVYAERGHGVVPYLVQNSFSTLSKFLAKTSQHLCVPSIMNFLRTDMEPAAHKLPLAHLEGNWKWHSWSIVIIFRVSTKHSSSAHGPRTTAHPSLTPPFLLLHLLMASYTILLSGVLLPVLRSWTLAHTSWPA